MGIKGKPLFKNSSQSFSMVPLIHPSDKIVVKKTAFFKTNDIVVFKKNDRLIAHRLIYIDPQKKYFIAKGDNNLKSDGKLRKNQVLGKVEIIERGKRKINLSHIYLSQSSNYLKEFKKLGESLSKNNIQYVILKGLPLHLHFNQSPPKRLYFDADLLIKKEYLSKAGKTLSKLGFKKQQHTLFGRKIKYPTQISYVKPTEPFPVVIDSHLEPAFGFTKLKGPNKLIPNKDRFQKHLFENIKYVRISDHKCPLLNIETLVVYLLLHLLHHNFNGAHRLEFINSLVKKQKINWKIVSEIINKFDLNNFIFPGILMLDKYYKTEFPKTLIKEIRPPSFQNELAQLIAVLVSPFDSGSRTMEGIKRFIFILLLSPHPISQKMRVILEDETRGYFLSTIKSFFLRSFKN